MSKSWIETLFEDAEREKFVHSRSKEVFDDIAGLWFQPESVRALAHIAATYIASSFFLQCLGHVYKLVMARHDLPEFRSEDLSSEVKRDAFLSALKVLEEDKTLGSWTSFALSECLNVLESLNDLDLETVAKMGNLADSVQKTAAAYAWKDNDGEIWVYDSIVEFADEVLRILGLHW